MSKNIITLGIGPGGSIKYFLTFGLDIGEPSDIPTVTITGKSIITTAVTGESVFTQQVTGQSVFTQGITGKSVM